MDFIVTPEDKEKQKITTVSCKIPTRERFNSLGKKDETSDVLLNKIMDVYEQSLN